MDTWNEDEIKRRAESLISKAFEIWEYPDVSQQTIDKYIDDEPVVNDTDNINVEDLRLDYWTEFNNYLNEHDDLFVYPTPSKDNWYSLFMNNGKAHIELTISAVLKNTINVHFRIKKNSNWTFDKLYNEKEAIESEMGMELEWDKAENNKISKIGKTLGIDLNNKDNWERAIEWQYDMAVKLRKVLLPRIENLE